MKRENLLWGITCAVTFMAMSALAHASPVLLVEADASSATGLQYAPVNFAGTTPLVSGGITYHALSTPGSGSVSTYSSHAATVCGRLLAADGLNNPVSDIYCVEASDFLNSCVQTNAPSTTAVLPGPVGNALKVVNHSWVGAYDDVGSYTGDELDRDAVRRMDYMIRREDLVMVGGAVSPWGGSDTPLTWANRNGIAVRGSQAFNPLHGSGIGKTHADLWGTGGAASYQTPDVSGYAAGLIDAADTNGWNNGTNGIRHEVVKSILMTGADKTDFDTLFTSWTSNGINNLDNANGAGRADYAASLAVLTSGPQAVASVSGTTVNLPAVTNAMAGWWYESSLGVNSSQALIVDLTSSVLTDLTATLAWDVTQTETGGGQYLDTTDTGVIFPDLDLELLPVSYSGGAYTLGSSLGVPGLMSKSTGLDSDNVEHLYFSSGSLNPGLYAFVISNNSGPDWNYGFSYRMDTTVIPEPGTFLLLVLGVIWACGMRRKSR